jgi:PAS domain S-box-containing protein
MTTEREAHRDAERSLQIVQSARDAIISTDREGRIVSWNSGAEELYGYSRSEALDRSISMIIPEVVKGEEWQLLRRALAGERVERYETLRLCLDGSALNVSLTLFALRDAAGDIIGAASIARDISERVAAQHELRDSEVRYRDILDSAYEGIWSVDAALVTDFVNLSMAGMLGYTVEEMLGRDLSDFTGEDRLRRAMASTRRQARGARERLEVTFLRKDATVLRALVTVNAVFDDAGAYVGNLVMVSDISLQRAAEAQQREVETFLAGVTATMEEGLLTLDAERLITTSNEAADRLLGYEHNDLVGRALCSCLGCEGHEGRPYAKGAECRLAAISSSAAPLRLEDELLLCSDGSRLPVALSVAPLGVEGGRPTGHVVVFQDISERKAASAHVQRELAEIGWIGRLRDAMDENRLDLAAQPIVSLASGEVAHHELLVRMRDRDGELVLPGEFLPAAERFGLIGELDRWVVAQASSLAAKKHRVNLNLSARSLGDLELAAYVERMLREDGADPTLVTFEITETALTEHPQEASAFATQVASLGCKFALDDFGTGYGAFTYLKLLPISYLKIDREFVHDVAESTASRHVVEAMVSLASGFGQETVAEGVEDESTLSVLRELGVDYAQGYHIASPAPIAEVLRGDTSTGQTAA